MLRGGTKNAAPRRCRKSHGAMIQETAAERLRPRKTRLAIEDARRQAPSWSDCVRSLVKVGTKAYASAPPAIRVNSISGSRLAALKASIWALVPKVRETNTHVTSAARLERTNAAMTVPAARAISRFAVLLVSVPGVDYSGRTARSR